MHSQKRDVNKHVNKHWLVDAASAQNKKLQNIEAKTNARCCKQTASLWQHGNLWYLVICKSNGIKNH